MRTWTVPAGRRRSPARDDAGVALVEFALVLPLLMLLLFGMIEFGKAVNYWIDESHLANTGARYAVVNNWPTKGTGTLQDYVKSLSDTGELKNGGSTSIAAPGVCIGVSFPTNTSTNTSGHVGDPVKVEAKVVYNWIPFIGGKIGFATSTITGSATMRLEALPTSYAATACP
jgi:Flp pilus assembly protein TadG